jgi:hypothetical protein
MRSQSKITGSMKNLIANGGFIASKKAEELRRGGRTEGA